MRKEGYSQASIASCLERDESTISREIGRNSGQRGSRHKQAQRKAEDRRFASRRRGKFTPVMQAEVEAHLRDDLSPEQVTGVMRSPKRKGPPESARRASIFSSVSKSLV